MQGDCSFSSSVVRAHLERLLESEQFRHSTRSGALLRHLVERTINGQEGDLKESLLGVHVFQRDPGFNSQADPIVRVTIRRVRAKLRSYYENEGRGEPLRIRIPSGSYVPLIESARLATVHSPRT